MKKFDFYALPLDAQKLLDKMINRSTSFEIVKELNKIKGVQVTNIDIINYIFN